MLLCLVLYSLSSNNILCYVIRSTLQKITVLTQIIFESEKKASQYAPLFTLREIIQHGNGSISSYLAKLGAFPIDYMTKQAAVTVNVERVSTDDIKQNLENRVATAARLNTADATSKVVAEKATVLPGSNQEEETPNLPLPSSNQNFNS